jgi:kynureninase
VIEKYRNIALELDRKDELAHFRQQFWLPRDNNNKELIYLCGNSLGLQPKITKSYVDQELEDWKNLGVEGHVHARNPWMPYHEFLTEKMAAIVGAKAIEVVMMNSLTVNLHLLMVSFYRPDNQRYKIIMESDAFPSDRYAIESQIKFHGKKVDDSLIVLKPRAGEKTIRTEDILAEIEKNADQLALIMIGGVNYYTGQVFDIKGITEAGHKAGAVVGFDLAHMAGNINPKLHENNVDFAAWCTYKYLNSGPGSVAGCFIHERHAEAADLPRFTGWWGHNKQTRFLMRDDFDPIPGAEGWQLSNPPILSLAAIRASLDIFSEAGMDNLRKKSLELTGFLLEILEQLSGDIIEIITPTNEHERGCQISIRVKNGNKSVFDKITSAGVIADWREPDVIRIAPTPLYNSFSELLSFAEILSNALEDH